MSEHVHFCTCSSLLVHFGILLVHFGATPWILGEDLETQESNRAFLGKSSANEPDCMTQSVNLLVGSIKGHQRDRKIFRLFSYAVHEEYLGILFLLLSPLGQRR